MHQKITCYSFFFILIIPRYIEASPPCTQPLATVVSVQGKVGRQYSGNYEWRIVQANDKFCRGDTIRTEKWSRAILVLRNDSLVTLDQSTTLIFSEPEENSSTWLLDLIEGSTFFRSRQQQRLNIQTPFINAVHKGTEFLVSVDDRQTRISVFDGQVAAENKEGRILINKGFAGIAQKHRPPRLQALTITPEDAVQWTLYYPPIVDVQSWKPSSTTPSLKSSLDAYRQGDIYQALAGLDDVPVTYQDAEYLTLKASLLLSVGRVDEAQMIIQQATRTQHDHSHLIALQSIIAVAKNQQNKALVLAQKSVARNPESSIAKIALSYAYQSLFNIEEALKSTVEATRLAPDNALAWARLAELQLSTGDRDGAFVSAQKAQNLNPKLARTQSVLGFADLAQVDINAAKRAFEEAITLDSSDPLPRLGLGLAKIRKGALEEGTKEIETAVNLDPNNAITRSYLGKAYYELRNKDFAGTELNLAKEMDPKDPTPWFYDAILKQTTNRPVEALHDMQQAIELNDNRGIYRSKLLLDEDAAARTANMARIYNDLDFGRVALKEAWKSLGYDSSNPSAHRFLSDAYIGQPRYRVARASELLQAQLLQPINITPVQPQLTGENIGILNSTGPGSLSVNEYDPLYNANGAHVVLNGAYGSNNTKTDNAIISGIYDKLSLSLGQFHYQTDGFRQNDDFNQDIYDAFAQYAFTSDLNVQVEFKTEDIRAGDVPIRLNGYHQENLRQTTEQDTARIGGHYKISSEQDLIAAFIYTSRKDNITDKLEFEEDFATDILYSTYVDGYQTEIQHIYHPSSFQLLTGLGYMSQFTKGFDDSIDSDQSGPFIDSHDSTLTRLRTDYFNAYTYLKNQIFSNLTTILGLSFDSFNSDVVDHQQLSTTCVRGNPDINCDDFRSEPTDRFQFNPKLGIIWSPASNLILRSAAFRTLNRPLATNQTIEPTQVAGFNQFFDGNNGATSWNYGIGLDYNPVKSVFLGGEVTWHNSKQPLSSSSINNLQTRNDSSHLAYLYWTPTEWASIKAEYRFDLLTRDFEIGQADPTNPRTITSHQVPISLNIFYPIGIFGKVSGTYVNQHVGSVDDDETSGFNPNFPLSYQSEDFWTFNTAIGYRFPKRYGAVSFEVRNLFDNHFKYQSTFDASGPQLTPYVPERQLFVKLSLYY